MEEGGRLLETCRGGTYGIWELLINQSKWDIGLIFEKEGHSCEAKLLKLLPFTSKVV